MRKEHIFAVAAYGVSPYLEGLLESLKNQRMKSEILLCTSTENYFLRKMAEKYRVPLLVREGEPNLRDDWNFAYEEGRKRARLVTIAHQDDVYDPEYAWEVRNAYQQYPDLSVFCCRYETIDGEGRRVFGLAESVKRLLRLGLRRPEHNNRREIKRSALRFGNGIGCPTCTYNSDQCGSPLFQQDYRFVIDWDTLLRLADEEGRFICVERPLLQYRVHGGSETMHQMENHTREREEEEIFRRMHGPRMTKLIMFFYKLSYQAYKGS